MFKRGCHDATRKRCKSRSGSSGMGLRSIAQAHATLQTCDAHYTPRNPPVAVQWCWGVTGATLEIFFEFFADSVRRVPQIQPRCWPNPFVGV